jgi:predicted cupin superfamily sugar epimerase
VAPGFEYDDMEIAGRDELKARYPQHVEIIARLTRA